MMSKLHITEKDRLWAAGLMAAVVFFSLPFDIEWRVSTALGYTIYIFATFAAGALVFSLSPLLRGSPLQRSLAFLFILPALVFFIIVLFN
jgi:hypothetical protein